MDEMLVMMKMYVCMLIIVQKKESLKGGRGSSRSRTDRLQAVQRHDRQVIEMEMGTRRARESVSIPQQTTAHFGNFSILLPSLPLLSCFLCPITVHQVSPDTCPSRLLFVSPLLLLLFTHPPHPHYIFGYFTSLFTFLLFLFLYYLVGVRFIFDFRFSLKIKVLAYIKIPPSQEIRVHPINFGA